MTHSILVSDKHYSDLNPVICGWEDCGPCHSFGPAVREYYLIHYIMSGSGTYQTSSATYTLTKNHFFLIRPHEITYYIADEKDPWSYIWIGFTGNLAEPLLQTSGLADNTNVQSAPFLRESFQSLLNAQKLASSTELYLCGKLYEIFALLQEANSPVRQEKSSLIYVNHARDFMKANYAQPVHIGDIANMLGIDRRYLCRIFSKHSGVTPQEYLVNLRLDKAAALLTQFDYSVGEVAKSVGYEDLYNFSNMFKRKFGVSPLNYKRMNRKII